MFNSARFLLGVIASLLALGGCAKVPETPIELARQYHHDAEWADTIAHCDLHLQVQPDDTEALKLRGHSYFALEQYEEALSDFNRWVELSPETLEAYYMREQVHRALGNDELALADRNFAVEHDPQHRSAYEYDPSNFATRVKIKRPMRSGDVATSESPEVETDGGPEPYEVAEPYAEPAEPYSDDVPRTAGSSDGAGDTDTPETDAANPGPNTPSTTPAGPEGPIAGAPAGRVPGVPGGAALPRRPEIAAPTPPQSPRPLSTALPPTPSTQALVPTTPNPGIAGSGLQPRTTGIQSGVPPASNPIATNPNSIFFGPNGLPFAMPPVSSGSRGGTRTSPGVTSQSPRHAPTGRLSTGLPATVVPGVGTPTQLAPPSPYALRPNPIPGQTPPTLSTSLPQTGSGPSTTPPKKPLSTALPNSSGSGS